MYYIYRSQFLTLVLLAVMLSFVIGTTLYAKPHFESPAIKDEVEEGDTKVDPATLENMSVSEPRKGLFDRYIYKFNKRDYYYPYRREFEVHVGTVFGIVDSSDSDRSANLLIGFNYLLPKLTSPKWEFGIDLSTVGHGHVHLSKRIIYNEKGSFRPYYEYGVMQKFVPDEKFASWSNWDNYLFRCGFGMSDILKPPKSVQMELEIAIGKEDILAFFTYGHAWGF